MTKPARPEMLAADHIRELTQHHTSSETGPNWVPIPTTLAPPYVRGARPDERRGWVLLPGTRVHVVHHLPLLQQIRQTVTTSTKGADVVAPVFGSKPAGRIDCLAFLERLDRQSHQLAREHGLPRVPLEDRLARLSGVLGVQAHRLVRAWWATARVLTQHDGPAYAPNIPCQVESCERWGTIRVRLDERLAVCVECSTMWDDESPLYQFARLALWASWSAEHLRGPRHWRTDKANSGYPDALGYRVECEECKPTRVEMTAREAARLRAVRPTRNDDTPHDRAC